MEKYNKWLDELNQILDNNIIMQDILINEEAQEIAMRIVCDLCNVTKEQIKSRSHSRKITIPRHILVYSLYTLTSMTYKEIGDFLNKKYPTIMHSKTYIDDRMSMNSQDLKLINNIRKNIQIVFQIHRMKKEIDNLLENIYNENNSSDII